MPGTPGAGIGTEWLTPEVWLRRTVRLREVDLPGGPVFMAHHDEDLEVYINGVRAGGATGFLTAYELMPM
ncbi:MAG: hypothetical protein FJX74_05765, partial [Armatimonadetes bacterium]|nr:hypothetical protein [Armatimonadota bacterium]